MTTPLNKTLIKTPLRYPGGKSRAINFLKQYFPKDFKEYREPFFGGGSVGLYIAQNYKNIRLYANDLNYNLYCFWQILKTDSIKLIDEISNIKYIYKDGRKLHNDILNRRNNINEFQRAVDFFVLNRISFSGLLDCGGYSNKAFQSRFTISSIERLGNVARIINNLDFSCESYESLLQKDGENVFIFLDPPYYSATKSKLYGIKGDLHTGFNHNLLHEILKSTKHKFLLTYDNSTFIKELYKDFHITEWGLQYGMNNFKQDKAKIGRELLISNFALHKQHVLF